jgi:hypothetical protein
MSDGSINAALRTIGYSGQDMTGNGFRAAGRTLIRERLGYDKEIVERTGGLAASLCQPAHDVVGRGRGVFAGPRQGGGDYIWSVAVSVPTVSSQSCSMR